MSRALGRYELLRPLARGGMAEVYLARRRAAGIEKWLVVKRMRPERSGDPRFLELFVREARLSMSLVHQNIVPVFDFGRIDEQVFLAMERVEGKDLGSSLARAATHRIPPLLAAFIAAECCQALDYAHQRKGPDGVALGIVHRDVTPRNVLLSWSGEVKLTDFGIAALAGEATSRLLGTPQYMAPEQARSEPIDRRADVYAMGLVLREAVTGARPRPGGDRDAILGAARRGALLPWAHLADPPPDAPDLALGTVDLPHSDEPPPALVAIIDRATAAAPDDRYPDAHAMFEDLDSFIVRQRAAHKAESPARQLAAWLSGVWDGARDDVESDATIDADHLLSFLDDGAIELIGTGTIRSLAATAADDALLVAAPAGAPPAPSPAPVTATNAAVESPARSDSSKRLARISSSISTVASGSFHTLPAPGAERASAPRTHDPPVRRPWRLAGLLLATAAAGAAALFVTTAIRDRGRADPVAATPPTNAALPNAALPNAALPNPALPNPASPNADPRNPASPSPASPNAALPNAASPNAASPNADPRNPALPNVASPNAASPNAASPNAASPNAASPNANSRNPASPNANSRNPASPNAASPNAEQPNADQRNADPRNAAQPNAAKLAQPTDASRPPTRPERPETGPSTSGPNRSPTEPARDGSAGVTSPERGNRNRPAAGLCRVRINLTPWAYYTADDDPTRHETPGTIDLAPGPHRLHVWNPELHIERDITINVPADRETMNYSEPLQPSTLAPEPRPRH